MAATSVGTKILSVICGYIVIIYVCVKNSNGLLSNCYWIMIKNVAALFEEEVEKDKSNNQKDKAGY